MSISISVVSKTKNVTVITNKYDSVEGLGHSCNIKKPFYLIYENVILNVDKAISFYNISSNDSVWIGKLEDYLKDDDIVVEVFVLGYVVERIFFIMKSYDTISNIKSKLNNFVQFESYNAWNARGISLANWHVITEVVNKDCRIVFSYNKDTFDDCCRFYNIYLLEKAYLFYSDLSWYKEDIFQKRDQLKETIQTIRSTILSDKSNEVSLSEIYAEIPIPVRNLKTMWFPEIVDRICSSETADMIAEQLRDFKDTINALYSTLYMTILPYVCNEGGESDGTTPTIDSFGIVQSVGNKDENTLAQIWNEVFDSLLDPMHTMRDLINLVVRHFKLGTVKSVDILSDYFKQTFDYLLVTKKKLTRGRIPLGTSVLHWKRDVAAENGLPLADIKLFKRGGDHILNDNESIDRFDAVTVVLPCLNMEQKCEIGRGGFGTVSLIRDKLSNTTLALKEFNVNPPGNQIVTVDVCRELSIISRLIGIFDTCPYIVQTSQFFHNGNSLQIGMEYMEKGSLGLYLRKNGAISVDKIGRVSHHILLAIEFLHKKKIVHRDIKGDNILIDCDFNAKLCDFGLSKHVYGLSQEILMENRKRYCPGTKFYMAPELINKEYCTNKIDIWSFGCTVIEMIIGSPPNFDKGEKRAFVLVARTRKIDFTSPESIPEELVDFVACCLKSDPTERHSATQLIKSRFISVFSDEKH